MTVRQLIIIAIAIAILAVGVLISNALAGMREAPERKKPEKVVRMVNVTEVQTDTLTMRIPIQGKLIAAQKVEIFPEVTGRLLTGNKPFKVGQHFDKGETLLAMDGSESLLNLKSQRSAFINLITQVLPDIKIDYNEHYEAWATYLDELDPNEALQELPDLGDSKLKNLISGRNIYQQFFAIRSLENRQSKFNIAAPFSGSVSMGSVNPGTVIRAGQKVGEFIQDGDFELEAAIPAEDATGVREGARVNLQTENGQSYDGTLIRVARNADPNTQRVTVFAQVSGEGLREGIYLNGFLGVDDVQNAISVNRNLIVDDRFVFVIQDSTLSKRPVQVKHYFEENALITGLKPGDLMLSQSIEGAYEGMLVEPIHTSAVQPTTETK